MVRVSLAQGQLSTRQRGLDIYFAYSEWGKLVVERRVLYVVLTTIPVSTEVTTEMRLLASVVVYTVLTADETVLTGLATTLSVVESTATAVVEATATTDEVQVASLLLSFCGSQELSSYG